MIWRHMTATWCNTVEVFITPPPPPSWFMAWAPIFFMASTVLHQVPVMGCQRAALMMVLDHWESKINLKGKT